MDSAKPLRSWSCGDPIQYQGYDYATVLIGDQCGCGKPPASTRTATPSLNLATAVVFHHFRRRGFVYGQRSSSCYHVSPNSDACDSGWSLNEYGYHTTGMRWTTLMACPSGWHVPTDGEWMTMEMALGMSEAEANDTGY